MSKKLFIFLSFFRPKTIIKWILLIWVCISCICSTIKLSKKIYYFQNIIQPENKMFLGTSLVHFLDQKILIPNLCLNSPWACWICFSHFWGKDRLWRYCRSHGCCASRCKWILWAGAWNFSFSSCYEVQNISPEGWTVGISTWSSEG